MPIVSAEARRGPGAFDNGRKAIAGFDVEIIGLRINQPLGGAPWR
ncbi:hypothetical protein [Erythrobacter sp.]|jgi:hypothetical protein|nr:hypothetical protein [Erythrobacter sp.]